MLSSWNDVIDYCRTSMAFADKEQFRVLFLDKRILTIDTPDADRFITAEKKNILVDAFVKWRRREKAYGAREIAGAVGEGGTIDNCWSLQCTEVL